MPLLWFFLCPLEFEFFRSTLSLAAWHLSLLPIKKSLLPIHGPHRPLHFLPHHFCFCKHIVKNPANIPLLLGLGIVHRPSRVVSQWCTTRVSFVDLLPHGFVLLFEGTINAGNHHAFSCCFRSCRVTVFCLFPPRIVTFSFTAIIDAGHAQQKIQQMSCFVITTLHLPVPSWCSARKPTTKPRSRLQRTLITGVERGSCRAKKSGLCLFLDSVDLFSFPRLESCSSCPGIHTERRKSQRPRYGRSDEM